MFPCYQASSCFGSFWGKLAFIGKLLLGRLSVFLSSSGSAMARSAGNPFFYCVFCAGLAVPSPRYTAGNIAKRSNLVCYNECRQPLQGAQPFPCLANPIARHTKGGVSASIVRGQTVPGNFNKLVPPPPPRPKLPATASQPSHPARPSFVPRFGRPAILVPDDFWSNLRQFLFQRPVKLRGRKDVPFVRASFGAGLFSNLWEFLRT